MPRTPAFDRDDVLHQCVELFRQRGFAATSMRDIQNTTGLAPTSLYAAFGSKDQLFATALGVYRQQFFDRLDTAVGDPQRGLVAIRDYLHDVANATCSNHGCFLCKVIIDGADAEAEDVVRDAYDYLEKLLTRAATAAHTYGELASQTEPRHAARLIQTVAFGLLVQARRGLSKRQLARLADLACDSLLP